MIEYLKDSYDSTLEDSYEQGWGKSLKRIFLKKTDFGKMIL